jgi:hypothetical protein
MPQELTNRQVFVKLATAAMLTVRDIYAPAQIEHYKTWSRRPRKGKGAYKPLCDSAEMTAVFEDLLTASMDHFKERGL